MPLIFQDFISRKDIKANPEWLYFFGDNEQREGKGGQAKEMRGEPNSFGIRTKRAPLTDPEVYWHDDTFHENITKVLEDFEMVFDALRLHKVVVFPAAGFGTDLAKLAQNAPLTLKFIENMIWLAKKYDDAV